MSERGLGRGLDHLIEQNATELGFLDAYGPTPEEALAEIFDAACHALAGLKGVRSEFVYLQGPVSEHSLEGESFPTAKALLAVIFSSPSSSPAPFFGMPLGVCQDHL